MKTKIINQITQESIHQAMNILQNTPVEIERLIQGYDEGILQSRPEPETWSPVEILAHLHACATIWGDSINKMVHQNSPFIDDTHPRKWARFSEFSALPFHESLQIFGMERNKLLALLTNLTLIDWARIGWIKQRKHSIFSQVRRMALHELDHLDQLKEMLISE